MQDPVTSFFSEVISAAIAVVMLVSWIAGVVVANAWWKLLAALFPPYAWYLVVELVMTRMGWIQ